MNFNGAWADLYHQLEPDIRKQVSFETFTKLKKLRPLRYQAADWIREQKPFDETE